MLVAFLQRPTVNGGYPTQPLLSLLFHALACPLCLDNMLAHPKINDRQVPYELVWPSHDQRWIGNEYRPVGGVDRTHVGEGNLS